MRILPPRFFGEPCDDRASTGYRTCDRRRSETPIRFDFREFAMTVILASTVAFVVLLSLDLLTDTPRPGKGPAQSNFTRAK